MKRVVIIGYGMAGARLAERLRHRDPEGSRVAVTAVGEEKRHPYNRVLLSTVLGGGMAPEAVALQDADWAVEHDVDLRLGVGAVAIDRPARTVGLTDGSFVDYDVLVLATGARSWLPPVDGLSDTDGELAPGVVTFRTLDDCERIRHATCAAPVAVVGGGLLGLEAACALAGGGCPVSVVHPVGHLMERQLDPVGGGVLARFLAGLGIDVHVSSPVARYLPGRGLELAGGEWVRADCVVVAAGVRPEVGLARRAGLVVDRGIAIDDTLRTSDPLVHAIGDCAEHPGTVSGLIQPAWEQAAVLADILTGTDARYHGTPAVTRLKASDVDLLALGDTQTGVDAVDVDVVCLTDYNRGRYTKIIIRGEEITGAIVLGAPDTAARVTQLYDRSQPVPADRVGLLLGRAAPDAPADGVVCRCNAVTHLALEAAWLAGARTVPELVGKTRATTGCGGCDTEVGRLVEQWGSAHASA